MQVTGPIYQFQGDFRFLSNFYPSAMLVRNMGTAQQQWVHTAEHLFQAFKTRNPREQQDILDLRSPGKAKKAGRLITLRDDWEDIKLDVMRVTVHAKFKQNPELRELLIDTGDLPLFEGNYWNDTYFGVDLRTGQGQNWLGKILMETREELRT